MMLAPLLLCQLLVQPVPPPTPLLAQLYLQQYGCTPQPVPLPLAGQEGQIGEGKAALSTPASAGVAVSDIGSFFPVPSHWWPVVSPRGVGQPLFEQLLVAGVKPGVLLPDHPLALLRPGTLWRYRRAVQGGAIPVQSLQPHAFGPFAARASFAAALGLRPLAAVAVDGWSDNLRAAGAGTYLIDHRSRAAQSVLPLPARYNRLGDSHFYYAGAQVPRGGGFAVVIDPPPPDAAALQSIVYPELGLSWHYAGADFHSSLDGLETSAHGYLVAASTLLAVPVGLFFETSWPALLRRMGTSISWLWLAVGLCVLVLLGLAALRRWRRGA